MNIRVHKSNYYKNSYCCVISPNNEPYIYYLNTVDGVILYAFTKYLKL